MSYTQITSTKFKINIIKSTIDILQKQITLNIFKTNIKFPKGSTFVILKADGKSKLISGNVIPGLKLKVTAEDKKTVKIYIVVKL